MFNWFIGDRKVRDLLAHAFWRKNQVLMPFTEAEAEVYMLSAGYSANIVVDLFFCLIGHRSPCNKRFSAIILKKLIILWKEF